MDYECTGYRIKTIIGYKPIYLANLCNYLTTTSDFNLDTKIFSIDLMLAYINIFNPSKEHIMINTILFNLSDNICVFK